MSAARSPNIRSTRCATAKHGLSACLAGRRRAAASTGAMAPSAVRASRLEIAALFLAQHEMVVPEGLEPPTPTLGKWRSIQLSYGTTRVVGSRRAESGQLHASGGMTGSGNGATGTPSSIISLAWALVAWPWIG